MMTYFIFPFVNIGYFVVAFITKFDDMFYSDYAGWGFTFVML